MKKPFLVAFIFAFTLLLNNPLYAQSICEGETGATYSSCNKYCEILDCDSLDPQGSDKACDTASAKYESLTGSLPPCVCPCVAQLPSTFEGQILNCENIDIPFCGANTTFYILEVLPDQNSDIQLELYTYLTCDENSQVISEEWACQATNNEIMNLTESEFLACQSFRDLHCAVP